MKNPIYTEADIKDHVLNYWYFRPHQTKAVVPDGVIYIFYRAFAYNDWIEEVVLPDSVKVIGSEAFVGCISLRSIKMPGCVKCYQTSFMGCKELSDIDITTLTYSDSVYSVFQDMICNNPKAAVNLYKRGLLTVHLAEVALRLATERDNSEVMALMIDFLHKYKKAEQNEGMVL